MRFQMKALLPAVCLAVAGTFAAPAAPGQAPAGGVTIEVDVSAPAQPFPHYWEKIFGSERAIVTLRESYRQDLHEVKRVTAFEYVRFHAILHDEMGVYDEDAQGNPIYNFSYVDQVYDGLLANGVRPFIELSFMPRKLAANPNAIHPFWYKQNVSPPKDWGQWEDLIEKFARHVVERYGIDEAAKWYFELWNEPNIDFWAGEPKFETYCELYERAARALKRVSQRLRVGGPATAQAAWVDRFIAYCVKNNVPLDFVSTHVYANDTSKDVFGTDEKIPRAQMVCRAVKKVHDQLKASARPELPLIWSEYNASYMNEPDVTDTAFMGPWLADTIRQCDGLVDEMAYWTFSDVFEEQGVVKTPFYGGFGLIAAGGIPKASFNAFALLHRLGKKRIPANSDSVLVTQREDGSLAIALWNLAPPEEAGEPKAVTLKWKGLKGARRATVTKIDGQHGSPLPAWEAMGKLRYPTQKQLEELRKAAAMPKPEIRELSGGTFRLTLPPHCLALVEVR